VALLGSLSVTLFGALWLLFDAFALFGSAGHRRNGRLTLSLLGATLRAMAMICLAEEIYDYRCAGCSASGCPARKSAAE
jgi:hypothetical protein